jgi:hypothetical protein
VRIIDFPDGPYIVSEPELVTRQCVRMENGKRVAFSVQHMASSIERRATAAEVEEWKRAK